MKKFLIGFFLAFSLFLVPRSVSAADVSFSFPDSWVYPSDSSFTSDYNTIFNNLKQNPNFTSISESGIACIHPRYVGSDYYIFVFVDITSQYSMDFYPSSYDTGFCFFCSKIYTAHFSKHDLNSALTCTFSVTNNPSSVSTAQDCLCYNVSSSYFCSSTSFYNGSSIQNYGLGYPFGALYHYDLSFHADFLTGFVTGFDYSTDAFVQWLIDTGKYQELPAYIGTSKLVSFIDFYKQWGSSNKLFVFKILEWMAHFNIGAQSLENRNILKSTIDRLYQEYLNSSYVTFISNSANQVHHRNNINTKTDDSDLTLVTDDPNDDIITSILRDILRGVIAIPTSIYNNSQAIISKLDSLNWTINIVNDGGSSSGSDLTPVLNKMDDIIDKLEADTVSVEIDQTTKDDTDDFFDGWNLQFSTALNNKFPVASQLRTFFTGFFERCGIDADSDGEVYQYYNPGVLSASSVSRSAVTASEADIVTDFLSKFDNSDPAFLDDASYHGVPDLSFSVGGNSVSIFDFRVYAKYRDKIHFIISFVIWTLYLLHLYKALPQIIGQVADVAVKTSDL